MKRLTLLAVVLVQLLTFATGVQANPGESRWVTRYDGPSNAYDQASSLAVSPDGTRIFVTGGATGSLTSLDLITFAYDTLNGAKLWGNRYNGPGDANDFATSIALSPDGGTVYVTGDSTGSGTSFDYVTIAYDASTGARGWVKRYNGSGNMDDIPSDMAVSADGTRLYVSGYSIGPTGDYDYATVAYDAASGANLWVKRNDGPGHFSDFANAVAVSPDGTKVFVTGASGGDYSTVAYDAASSSKIWVMRYHGPGDLSGNEARAIAVSPDGGMVYVTGSIAGASTGQDFATLAYDTSTGVTLWATQHRSPGNDVAYALALSPDGSQLFATGSGGPGSGTIAYDATSGAQTWTRRHLGSGGTRAIAVSPDGTLVFVTGTAYNSSTAQDYITTAYDAVAGVSIWAKRYNGPGNNDDFAEAAGVSPDGTTVYVTGGSLGSNTDIDFATIAYEA